MVFTAHVLLNRFSASHIQLHMLTPATASGVTHAAHAGMEKIKTSVKCVQGGIKSIHVSNIVQL